MKKFYLYIICIMIISYFDMIYNLKSILLFTFFILSLPFFNDERSSFRISFFKIDKIFTVYILIFSLSFTVFFSLLPFLIFKDYDIGKIGNYSNYGVLKVLLISPLLEEIIFRGSLLPLLIKTESSKKAVLFSSLGFSITHYLSNSSLFAIFVLGTFLAYVYLKTESVFLCFIAHALNNFLALVFCPFLISILRIKETSYYTLIFIIMSSIIMLYSLFKIYKQNKK
ncbi:CPBP family intramembrane glutamic endopeptidase [Flavobacterium sp.]|uniref:CPBP family intramembrane glutamic endopeptidase n=1 Tax=Flavobacterium sp. TaxID=239 RepID=UPI002602FC52|nr:type II CAAX endopeptidase family protein [Flavobacterium sp.]